jgi:hypothetical protein
VIPGKYRYLSRIPAGCQGHTYRLIAPVLDVPSMQRKVLVEALTGPDAGELFVCTVDNFTRRYEAIPEKPAETLPAPEEIKS